jgi:release factor glutamine methyltransferase
VFAEEEAGLLVEATASRAELEELVQRRLAGVPLEHLLGWAEFCGLRIHVTDGVFVPRRRTELLVREALRVVRDETAADLPDRPPERPGPPGSGRVVVDLCCGSGAVGAAIAAAVPGVEVLAADVSTGAVRCARTNLPPERVFLGDLYDALPTRLRGRVDVLAVNAPYVPTDQIAAMPAEARDHEPRPALDGGPDGLDVQRRVAAEAGTWLAPGGRLLVETSRPQAPGTVAACAAGGLTARVVTDDDLAATVVVAGRP